MTVTPMKTMPIITNISAYKFAPLTNLKPLREHLIQHCAVAKLKGTILLSTEGINLFVAGGQHQIQSLLGELRQVPGLEDLEPKISESADQPFRRMLVKIKKEIIAFGVEGIDPAREPAPKLAPQELKRWLDEGRPLTLLDTRNDYEVQLGTFQRALTLDISHFRQFPDAVRSLPAEMKRQPIVMFCTGGIRCEKAGPFMQREGYENIFQLDGGILKYFELCGGAHYEGECFVFDQRVGVDPSLHESEAAQCFVCQSPLTPEEQQDVRFVEGLSCPYCYKTTEEQRANTLAQRHDRIRQVVDPLPGSRPYENERPLNVPADYDGRSLLDFLCGILGHIPREEWKRICDEGRIRKRGQPLSRNSHREPGPGQAESAIAVAHDQIVRAGQRYLHIIPGTREPDVNVQIRILYEDEAMIVVHKPAPLPTHPSGRFSRNTLQYILSRVYFPQSPRPSHRLDANTSGLVVFARTRHFAKRIQQQFEHDSHETVQKRYLARVHGHPHETQFECARPISADAGQLGSREIDDEQGQAALTHFKVLQRFPDGTTLLEVTPITGRTNQIRVHLWHLGHPICGDATYRVGNVLGDTQTTSTDASPLCLLAQRIELTHPLTGERVQFETDLPLWADPAFDPEPRN